MHFEKDQWLHYDEWFPVAVTGFKETGGHGSILWIAVVRTEMVEMEEVGRF